MPASAPLLGQRHLPHVVVVADAGEDERRALARLPPGSTRGARRSAPPTPRRARWCGCRPSPDGRRAPGARPSENPSRPDRRMPPAHSLRRSLATNRRAGPCLKARPPRPADASIQPCSPLGSTMRSQPPLSSRTSTSLPAWSLNRTTLSLWLPARASISRGNTTATRVGRELVQRERRHRGREQDGGDHRCPGQRLVAPTTSAAPAATTAGR